jgi:hypothetical protein
MVLPRELLRAGENILALQGLNRSLESSDFSLIPVLVGELPVDPARDREVLESFQEQPGDTPEAAARVAYLEARALQRAGRHADAAENFAAVIAQDASRPLPFLRRAQALLAAGDPEDAERTLRRALNDGLEWGGELWNLWLAVSFAHLGRAPQELLADLPWGNTAGAGEDARGSSAREDARWLLERLAGAETIRMNCGGRDFEGEDGRRWSRDRFYRGGHPSSSWQRRDFPDAEDGELYRTRRWFSVTSFQPGYRIPAPRGAYRVTLHAVESYFREKGRRKFTVRVEGERIPEAGEIELSYDEPERIVVESRVDDGVLDVEFVHGTANHPKISAMEIVRIRDE